MVDSGGSAGRLDFLGNTSHGRPLPPGKKTAAPSHARAAEDALQDALLAAWQGLGGFEGRASIRKWLYRIAINRCLNVLRSADRRPAKAWDMPAVEPPEPTWLGEVAWLEPFPDALLKGAIDMPLGPEARIEA
ncbi:hypothetical protein GCM10009609_00220 [Pseudonocardia aurantiaca]|uniref:Sigma factor n=1 Tax=Pseudonocardia aurantiaca TaxID=75290 RepID=A0ABW4FHJ0_9PSEU